MKGNEKEIRYFKCYKCGEKVMIESTIRPNVVDSPINLDPNIIIIKPSEYVMCTQPMSYRTSGICGGSYDIEITENEFKLDDNEEN